MDHDPEREIRAAHESGALQAAATLALKLHGPALARYLQARLRTRTQAEDAFLQLSEDMWVGLPNFRWQASMRVWLFTIARNAATRVGRAPQHEEPLRVAHEDDAAFRAVVRTSTAQFMRSEVKNRMRQLRLMLDDDEQNLLILRIDRGMDWKELVVVLGEVDGEVSEEELKRAAARLRTRFQTAKKKLRRLAEADGLIERSSSESAAP